MCSSSKLTYHDQLAYHQVMVVLYCRWSQLCEQFRDIRSTIANYFNEYFVNIGADLSSRLPQCSSNNNFYDFMPCSVSQSIFCEDISTDELFQTIAHLKNKKSSGPDNISTFILKQCSDILTSPLLHIFNSSLFEGEFPNQLKVAKVVPIFKNGDAMLVSNYRPISLLNVLSKILERLVYKRVLDFLNKNDILYKYQFGFRTGFSTSLALMEVTDMIYDCLDNNLLVLGLFLDLKKAFDTVNHEILLQKLYHYGIRGSLFKWFESYLFNRTQYTCINGTSSTMLQVRCGVPQGSVLGPLLFLVYINDVANISTDFKIRLFADDSNLFIYHKNVFSLYQIANNLLQNLHEWFLLNKLSWESQLYVV